MFYILTAIASMITTCTYIYLCILLQLIMYILNINPSTRYCHPLIRPRTYKNLHKYLKQWRTTLAHLNKRIDIYFKSNYKPAAYTLRKRIPRELQLNYYPRGYIKRKRRHQARVTCINKKLIIHIPTIAKQR